ncbi:MAG: carbohydrate binding domain-containing protein [Planctomycetota bacterium]|nr:carbohydrate binding domain-containing protein [Planctomycetota bacterium]
MRQQLALLCGGIVCLAAGAPAADLAPFAPPWDDASPGATNLADTLHKPAGRFGHIRVQDGHLFAGDQRIRFFGTNLTAGACFPDHDTADKVAARMAKFGFNAVRFHFLDSTWGTPRLINYESGSWSNWIPESLERLDYFIARLREQGIYANLNLLVGRRFGVNDGVDPSVNKLDWKAAHAVGFFHKPHLEAQKAYARQLLTHRNPYTKLTYAEDPAVAFVEINNENGLIHTWFSGAFDQLPEVFARDLQAQWNAWLAARYPTTEALAKAWGARNEPLGAEVLANAAFAQGVQSWSVEQHEGAKMDASAENGTAILRVAKTGSAGWHVQFNQSKLKLEKGGIYTASFRAAADKPRKITAGAMQAHDPWQNLGFHTTIELDKPPREFSFTFIASDGDDNARFGFAEMNQEGAEFRFAGVSLKPGGRVGLLPDEALEQKTIRPPKAAEARSLPADGKQDWIRFLWETERRHWVEMRRFLHEELGVKAPVVGTIVATSTPRLMAEMDAVDTHAYWEHPHFPGKPWDRNNWFVKNISMVDYLDRATVTRLAMQRVAGKPHLVTEYNHPAPNTHAGEGPLFIAAFGGLQDWDAVFLYNYSHDETRTKAGRIPDFFDIGQHPTIMANVLIASLLFRRGDMQPARQVLSLPLPEAREIELIAQKGHAWEILPVEQLGLDPRNTVLHRVALDVTGKQAAALQDEAAGKKELTSDTGELAWRVPDKDKGVLEVRTPRTKAVVGHVDGQTVDLGHGVRVTVGKTKTGWCTVALTVPEGESFERAPAHVLLVATGYTENTGMGWKNEEKSSVGTDWGKPPSLVEPVAAIIRLPGAALPTVYPLNDRGQRGQPLTAAAKDGGVEFEIGPAGATLWYEVVFPPAK